MKNGSVPYASFTLPTTPTGWRDLYLAYVRDVCIRQADIPQHAFRVCLVVALETLDKGKAIAPITRVDFVAATGLSSESVARGVKHAISRGLITCHGVCLYACAMPNKGVPNG